MKELDCGLYIDKKYNHELLDVIRQLQEKDQALKQEQKKLRLPHYSRTDGQTAGKTVLKHGYKPNRFQDD